MKSRIRIAIPIIGGRHWLGGVTYVDALVQAFCFLPPAERPSLQLVVRPHDIPALPYHHASLKYFKSVILVGGAASILGALPRDITVMEAKDEQALSVVTDFYYPVLSDVLPGVCSASWIPDFQHIHLPHFFSEEERLARNNCFARVAEQAKMIVFSSQGAQQDFQRLYPHSTASRRILHFHTPVNQSLFNDDPAIASSQYELPERYFICCNQFWKHKNHLLLFEALAELRDSGTQIPLVCTGSLEDYRFADYTKTVLDSLNRQKLGGQVILLGTIPREHQLQLIRRAEVLIQPSLFEGWSTVVEDGRALGKRMLLSDLPVHIEQAAPYAEYFNRTSKDDLKAALSAMWSSPESVLNHERERKAVLSAKQDQLRFAEEAFQLANDTVHIFRHQEYESSPSFKRRFTSYHLLDHTLQ
jgi:glycosyltransferase involved in cell wall biosynthesis